MIAELFRGSKVSEKRTRLMLEVIKTITFTLLIFLVIRVAVQSFRVEEESMQLGG